MKKNIGLALLLLLVTACGPTRITSNPSPLQETEHVVLTDRVHKRALRIVKSKIEKLPSGQTEVSLEIENHRDADVPTDIQVIFRGSDGFEIEKTSWTPFNFIRREVSTFKAVSMNPNVSDYRVVIAKPKN